MVTIPLKILMSHRETKIMKVLQIIDLNLESISYLKMMQSEGNQYREYLRNWNSFYLMIINNDEKWNPNSILFHFNADEYLYITYYAQIISEYLVTYGDSNDDSTLRELQEWMNEYNKLNAKTTVLEKEELIVHLQKMWHKKAEKYIDDGNLSDVT